MEQVQLLPPSYGSLFNQHRSGISYIDFLPEKKKDGIFSKTECERFSTVVDCANQWLRLNPQWEINTCESVEFYDDFGGRHPSKMIYYQNTKHRTKFVRGLRLWLKVFPPGEAREQKIGYVNFVPQSNEDVDDIISRFNNNRLMYPLPGRIITIETQEMKLKSDGSVDADRSRWTDYGPHCTKIAYVIRIFYEVCNPALEEIGMTDFVPEILGTNCLGMVNKCETFSELFQKASLWCSSQTDWKVCNIQYLMTRVIKLQEGANTRKMVYTWSWTTPTTFLRILRVAHVRQQRMDRISPVQITCKTFIPGLVNSAHLFNCFQPEFENIETTMQRVSNWIQETGADVVNMETSCVALKMKGARHSSEKNYYYDSRKAQYYIFVIRAYLKGSYNDPFEDVESKPLCQMRSIACIASIIVILFLISPFFYFSIIHWI